MVITATQLKSRLSYYLNLAKEEEVIVTKNGKPIARLIGEEGDRISMARSLFGILPPSVSLSEAREERLKKHALND